MKSLPRIHRPFLLSIVFSINWALPAAAEDALLVKGGKPASVIVLPEEPHELEKLAAEELVSHIQLISGAELTITSTTDAPDNLTWIRIGSASDESLDKLTKDAGKNPSSFTLKAGKGRVDIRGLAPEGTVIGAYELLEQLGVRWYMPGDFGRVVPDSKTLKLKEQTTSQAPSMVYRLLQHLDTGVPWARRARLGGEPRSTGRHGIPGLDKDAFKEHPEYYSLINGVRRAKQDCLSNPDVLKRAIAGMRKQAEAQVSKGATGAIYVGASSHDGSGYCECEDCRALDRGVYDPTADRESMTDRYIWFFNQVLDALEEDFPKLHIVTYTYGAHMMPPDITPNPRIVPVFAPITLDRNRSMDNPMGTDRHMLRWLIDEWAESGVNEMYFRGYYHNLACPQFPFSQQDRVRNETKAFHERGISVMRVENIHTSWSSAFLDLYVATRVMWDVDTDVDALLDEFYRLYYGPAEKAMRAYHEGLDAAFEETPYFTGSSYVYFPIFLGHPRRDKLRSHLDAAAKTAKKSGDEDIQKRIDAVRLNWDRLDIFLDMIDARNRHDFKTANQKQAEYWELSEKGVNTVLETGARRGYTNPRLVYSREGLDFGAGYFKRFFKRPVDAGYERTVEKGELVAPLADEWQFLLDPANIGELTGYPRPGQVGGNWKPMRTTSRSWSDQGLHYYKGMAWYRQKVKIPKSFKGRKLYLWFGGVDELASVWINGEYIGTNREPLEGLPGVPGTFRPFDMPATKQVKYGEDNWVVVRIANERLNELGTGGIVAPVMFWSPTGDWNPGAGK